MTDDMQYAHGDVKGWMYRGLDRRYWTATCSRGPNEGNTQMVFDGRAWSNNRSVSFPCAVTDDFGALAAVPREPGEPFGYSEFWSLVLAHVNAMAQFVTTTPVEQDGYRWSSEGGRLRAVECRR